MPPRLTPSLEILLVVLQVGFCPVSIVQFATAGPITSLNPSPFSAVSPPGVLFTSIRCSLTARRSLGNLRWRKPPADATAGKAAATKQGGSFRFDTSYPSRDTDSITRLRPEIL